MKHIPPILIKDPLYNLYCNHILNDNNILENFDFIWNGLISILNNKNIDTKWQNDWFSKENSNLNTTLSLVITRLNDYLSIAFPFDLIKEHKWRDFWLDKVDQLSRRSIKVEISCPKPIEKVDSTELLLCKDGTLVSLSWQGSRHTAIIKTVRTNIQIKRVRSQSIKKTEKIVLLFLTNVLQAKKIKSKTKNPYQRNIAVTQPPFICIDQQLD